MNKKLAIFGPYPPPLGGISVHIKRMETYLLEKKIDYMIFNHGFVSNDNVIATKKKSFWYLKLLFEKKFDVFHFHQFFFFHFFYYLIFSLLKNNKIIVTIHSERILGYGCLKKWLVLFLISKTKRLSLISVSKNLNDYLKQNDIESIFLPAYVPPSTSIKNTHLESAYNGNLFLFSVWKFNQKLAKEVYNVPLVFKFLKANKQEFKMLFMIGSKSNSDLKYLDILVHEYNLMDNIIIMFDENLVEYVNNCKFLIRPNLSDGYGVSIQEALDLGIPAIASNVCERPKGTVLFENNNLEDLTEKVKYVLNTPKQHIINKKENLFYHKKLINKYLKILNDETGHTKF